MTDEPKQDPKRFLLFSGANYYPVGGWDDFKGAFDTVKEATDEGYRKGDDWFHVVDRETLELMIA